MGRRILAWALFSLALLPLSASLLLAQEDESKERILKVLRGHKDWVYSVSFSPDGKKLASGSLDGTLIIEDRG